MLVLCPFPVGVAAGQRLKYEQYFDDWRGLGFEIDVSPFMDLRTWDVAYARGSYWRKITGILRGYGRRLRDMRRIADYDLVYVYKWVTPFRPSAWERLTRLLARRLVLDAEDNVFARQALPRGHHPNHLARLLKGPGKVRYLIRTADHVITATPFVNDGCVAINRRRACTYISSSVDTDRFQPANRYCSGAPVTIGWTGTFSSKIYLDMLRDVWPELARRVPFRLKVVSNFDYHLDGVELEVVRWTKEREVQDLQSFDIGVYPLSFDDWALGKSGLKLIQYMAFGLPAVATAVGTNPTIVTDGVNGLLVKSRDDWLLALERLVTDPALRRRIGQAARARVVELYSTGAIAGKYCAVLEDVMEIPA